MPTYDYKCGNCHNTFEFFQSMKDKPMTLCPECGHSTLKKQVSLPAGLIFKGTGFYLTDYAKKKTTPSVSSTTSENTANTSSSESTTSTSSSESTAKKENNGNKESKNNKDK